MAKRLLCLRVYGVLFFALTIMLAAAGCQLEQGSGYERIPVTFSDIFTLDSSNAADSGYISRDTEDNYKFTKHSEGVPAGGADGVFLKKSVDSWLSAVGGVYDASAYDGFVFRYRSNADIGIYTDEKSQRWVVWYWNTGAYANGYLLNSGKAEPFFNCPEGEFKEVIFPFNKYQSHIITNPGQNYNTDVFDYNQIVRMMFDLRNNKRDSNDGWIEIRDFDFFVYK
ncbi:MAG: hypothetical protein LBF74_04760 [Treponema sp.]|jgi:hypothetical protein|nr:hypothetical protein [Treponema sp.]